MTPDIRARRPFLPQVLHHRDGSRSWVIIDVETGWIHERSDAWLRSFPEGTQRTYAFHLKDHLTWLVRHGRDESSVTMADLRRYLALCGAVLAGPLGEVWLDEPLSDSTLQGRAAVLKGYYLFTCEREGVNASLREALAVARFSAKAERNRSGRGPARVMVAANPLSPTVARVHPKMLPDGVSEALFEEARSARDRMVIRWLTDSGLRIGELCGLRFSDLHLVVNHECGERRVPHVHVVLRENNPNRARAKRGRRPADRTDSRGNLVVRGGRTVAVSPAMIDTYYDYLINDYYPLRPVIDHYQVLVAFGRKAGAALTTDAARKMLGRLASASGLDTARPHAFRHTWATLLYKVSGGDSAAVAAEGGWSSPRTMEDIYTHVGGSAAMDELVSAVWAWLPDRPANDVGSVDG